MGPVLGRLTGHASNVSVMGAVVERLRAAGCVCAEDEAAELLAAAPDDATLDAWITRREQGEPLPWITGTMRFCSRTIHVDPGVYVPRFQSEELARRAAAVLPSRGRAVDLCTGAGAIAHHLRSAVLNSVVIGVDIDLRAVACARRNGVTAIVGDVDAPLAARSFDVVTAVAPYVPTAELAYLPIDVQRHEPVVALDGGDDGLSVVRRVVCAAGRLLRSGGWLLIEVGGTQDADLAPDLDRFASTVPWYDDEGDLRGIAALHR